jgi:hypothetical protein
MPHVRHVARDEHVPFFRGNQRDVSITDIVRARPPTELPDITRSDVERRDHAMVERSTEQRLSSASPPHLRKRCARNYHIDAARRSELQHRPHLSIVALESD